MCALWEKADQLSTHLKTPVCSAHGGKVIEGMNYFLYLIIFIIFLWKTQNIPSGQMLTFYRNLALNFYFLRPVLRDWYLSRGFHCNHNTQPGHSIHARLRYELSVGENACLSQIRILITVGSQDGKAGGRVGGGVDRCGLYFLKAMAGSLGVH